MRTEKLQLRRILLLVAFGLQLFAGAAVSQEPAIETIKLPNKPDSVRMAVIGDSGRGSRKQFELAAVMDRFQESFPFTAVLMTGDNIYYGDSPEDMRRKFEDPYGPLLARGVKFFASLGNHDERDQVNYPLFNMGGRAFYRIEMGDAAIYALDTTQLVDDKGDPAQIEWLKGQLARETKPWRIAFFHHPIYSSGKRHGSDEDLRAMLEPVLIAGGVNAVFSGHDHFYERIKPQNQIAYFITGAAGKIRKGNIRKGSPLTAAGYDADLSFMLIELAGDEMHFRAVARDSSVVDQGVIKRREKARTSVFGGD